MREISTHAQHAPIRKIIKHPCLVITMFLVFLQFRVIIRTQTHFFFLNTSVTMPSLPFNQKCQLWGWQPTPGPVPQQGSCTSQSKHDCHNDTQNAAKLHQISFLFFYCGNSQFHFFQWKLTRSCCTPIRVCPDHDKIAEFNACIKPSYHDDDWKFEGHYLCPEHESFKNAYPIHVVCCGFTEFIEYVWLIGGWLVVVWYRRLIGGWLVVVWYRRLVDGLLVDVWCGRLVGGWLVVLWYGRLIDGWLVSVMLGHINDIILFNYKHAFEHCKKWPETRRRGWWSVIFDLL